MVIDELIHELAEERGWQLRYLEAEDVYRLTLPLPGDRLQDVCVNFREDDEGWSIATMWSVIAPEKDFDLSNAAELLRFNWLNLYGSLALRGEQVVLVHNQLAHEAGWNEVARAMGNMAHAADAIERELAGDRDRY